MTVHGIQPIWQAPPPSLLLQATEVHVWRFYLDQQAVPLQMLADSLSADEERRAERFRSWHDRQRFVAGRGWLRSLLAWYLAISPQAVTFAYLPHGKPIVTNDPTLQFNIAHSQNLLLCAVTQHHAVGVDVEYLRSITALELAQRFFRPSEWAILATMDLAEQQRMFLRYWTCKEAYLKACGDGLGKLQGVEVALGEAAQLAWLADDRCDRWRLWEFCPDVVCMAAVAVANPISRLQFWDGSGFFPHN